MNGLRRAADRGNALPGSNANIYTNAVVALCLLGVLGVLGTLLLKPDNTIGIIAAILGFLLPTVQALQAAATREVGAKTDGRVSELIMNVSRRSAAEARLEEKAQTMETVKELALQIPPPAVEVVVKNHDEEP